MTPLLPGICVVTQYEYLNYITVDFQCLYDSLHLKVEPGMSTQVQTPAKSPRNPAGRPAQFAACSFALYHTLHGLHRSEDSEADMDKIRQANRILNSPRGEKD